MNCPSCGYCAHCGRGGQQMAPKWWEQTWYTPVATQYAPVVTNGATIDWSKIVGQVATTDGSKVTLKK